MFTTFEEFFRADFHNLIGFLINLGYSEDMARDAAEDAMVVACRKWKSLESPKAWVRKVARNKAEELRKREARIDEIMLMAATDPGIEAGAEGDPERRWLLSEEAGRVARMLERLAPHRRLVMALHLDGFSAAEIAWVTGIKQNTVRSHLRHAREQLLRNLHGGTKWPDDQENTEDDSRIGVTS